MAKCPKTDARRMHVGKIKYRDQHRAEDRANTSDRGGGEMVRGTVTVY